jgi:uncharacterized protein involved in tolerance to divalent cations
MKNVTYLLLFFFLTLTTTAQGVFSNQTNVALQRVIEDFPNHFRNIKGDLITDNGSDYKSKVEIPGAITCVITENGPGKDIYAWKAELYQTREFDMARKKFSELYNQIHNTIIKIEGEKPVILNGKYEVPDGEKKFTSIGFHVLPATGQMRTLKVELALHESAGAWKISLNVFDQNGHTDFAAEQ